MLHENLSVMNPIFDEIENDEHQNAVNFSIPAEPPLAMIQHDHCYMTLMDSQNEVEINSEVNGKIMNGHDDTISIESDNMNEQYDTISIESENVHSDEQYDTISIESDMNEKYETISIESENVHSDDEIESENEDLVVQHEVEINSEVVDESDDSEAIESESFINQYGRGLAAAHADNTGTLLAIKSKNKRVYRTLNAAGIRLELKFNPPKIPDIVQWLKLCITELLEFVQHELEIMPQDRVGIVFSNTNNAKIDFFFEF